MKEDIQGLVDKLQPALKSILDRGFYEEEVLIGQDKVLIHKLTKGEKVSASEASGSADLITREHKREIEILAHAVSQINGVKFKNHQEAVNFFFALDEDVFEVWYELYNGLQAKTKEAVLALRESLKNLQKDQKDAVSGS
jgi:hypothetical protein